MKPFSLIGLAAVLAAASCSGNGTGADVRNIQYAAAPGSVKMISYNVRNSGKDPYKNDGDNCWENRKQASLNMIEEQAPAVIGMQEVLPLQMEYFKTGLPQYGYIGVGRDDGKEAGEVMAIFYHKDALSLLDGGTFWLSETPDVPSKGWDAACYRTATWAKFQDKASGKEFYYVNTHLDHIGEVARLESVKLIIERLSAWSGDNIPVFVGGDLNSPSENAIFVPLAENGCSLARTATPDTDNHGTFNAFGTAPSSIVIDHIYFKGNVQPKTYKVLNGDYGVPFISDHYPVAFEFNLL